MLRNLAVYLLVLLLCVGLISCCCRAEITESSDSGRDHSKLRRTLRTQHTKPSGTPSRNVSEVEDQRGVAAAHRTQPGPTHSTVQGQSLLLSEGDGERRVLHDKPSSVLSTKSPPDSTGELKSEESAPQLRIPKILHQLYFVSDKQKDYETGTIEDKQFPKKWQASCKAAFPDWEYR